MTTQLADRAPLAAAETFPERHAWKLLLAVGFIIAFFGLMDLSGGATGFREGEVVLIHSVTNMSWDELKAADPGAANLIDMQSRGGGAALFTAGLLSSSVALTAFRRRERWAWWALWALPVWMALAVLVVLTAVRYPGYGTPVPAISGSIMFVLCAAALGLSYRPFFRKTGKA